MTLRQALSWRPEWPYIGLIVVAWAVMAAGSFTPAAGTNVPNVFVCVIALGPAFQPLALTGLAGWAVMSVAMMLPITLPWLRYVALNSIRTRRSLAMLLYASGYLAVWMVIGAIELFVAVAANQSGPRPLVIGAGLLIAGCWEFSTFKRVTLARCHWVVALPPVGRRANFACLHFGVRRGLSCVSTSWALMLVVALVGVTQVALMVVVTALALTEERTKVGWRLLPMSGAVLVAAAIVATISG